MPYYAHIRQGEAGTDLHQTVAEHLTGTAALCREFADTFGAGAEGELAGLTHDIGKCTEGFQNRLLHDGPIVDHATAGAVVCAKQGHMFTAACVAGHHSGLLDFGNPRTAQAGDATLFGRIKKGGAERYPERCGESGVALPSGFPSMAPERDKLQTSFWTRMLYSSLVDADFLDTERFMQGDLGRGGAGDIETLLKKWRHISNPGKTRRAS